MHNGMSGLMVDVLRTSMSSPAIPLMKARPLSRRGFPDLQMVCVCPLLYVRARYAVESSRIYVDIGGHPKSIVDRRETM